MIPYLPDRKWLENRKVLEKIYVFQNYLQEISLTIGTQITMINHDVLL